MDNKTNRYLTEKEVSALTGISISKLRNMRWKNWKGETLPYIKLSKLVRYSESAIREYMDSHTII